MVEFFLVDYYELCVLCFVGFLGVVVELLDVWVDGLDD